MSETPYWRDTEFLTPKQIGEILNVHYNTAYNIVHQMPHIKIGMTYRVSTKAFEKWLRDQERKCAT